MKNDDLIYKDKSEKPSVVLRISIIIILSILSIVIYREFLSGYIASSPDTRFGGADFDYSVPVKVGDTELRFYDHIVFSRLTDYQYSQLITGNPFIFFVYFNDIKPSGELRLELLRPSFDMTNDDIDVSIFNRFNAKRASDFSHFRKDSFAYIVCDVASERNFVYCFPLLYYAPHGNGWVLEKKFYNFGDIDVIPSF